MSTRRWHLTQYINTVLAKYPDAKYTIIDGLWYIRCNGKIIGYGQATPYKAWRNAAESLRDKP